MASEDGEGIKENCDIPSGDDKSNGVDQNGTQQVAQLSRQWDAEKQEKEVPHCQLG